MNRIQRSHLLLALLAQLATASQAFADTSKDRDPSDTKRPYYESEATSVTLDKSEYNDLVAYLEQARDTLTKTMADARKLGARDEHMRLVSGAEDAIKQSGFKYDLLLFRHVLERALDIDGVYMQGVGTQSVAGIHSRYDAANLVLLVNLRKAIEYYNSGRGDVKSEVIPVPNWVAFATSNIPLYEKEITLAPSRRAMIEIALRALGWTARALNTSLERKEFAREIEDLMAMREQLEKDAVPVASAQQLLLDVHERLLKRAKQASAADGVPKQAYPAPSSGGDSNSTSDPTVYKGLFAGVETNDSMLRMDVQAGLGMIVESESQRSTKYFAQLSARATLVGGGMASKAFMAAGGAADLRARYAQGSLPMYRFKAQAFGGGIVAANLWGAIEANKFQSLREEIARGGWSPAAVIKIDQQSYVLIRAGVGAVLSSTTTSQAVLKRSGSEIGKGTEYTDKTQVTGVQGLTLDASAVLKLCNFLIQVEATADRPFADTPDSPTRLSASLDVSIPLKLIFGNEALKLEADAVHYNFNTPALSNVTILEAGVSYLVRW